MQRRWFSSAMPALTPMRPAISSGDSLRASSTSADACSINSGWLARRVVGAVSKSSVLAGEITVSMLWFPSVICRAPCSPPHRGPL